MTLFEFSDAASFLQKTKTHLMLLEDLNNMLLSSVETLAKSASTRSELLQFFALLDRAEVRGAALNASNRKLLLSAMKEDATAAMAREIRIRQERGLHINGLFAPRSTADIFVREMERLGAPALKPGMQQRAMRLDDLKRLELSVGQMRKATLRDLPQVTEWCRKFIEECKLDEPLDETVEVSRKFIENERLFLWQNESLKAMAAFGGLTTHGARISMVYTDLESRGAGYARSLVQSLSGKLLDEGRQFCFLFTDESNPVSNRLYEKIGYRDIGEFSEFRKTRGT
jgi:predicted GNAT family acetyltransferase